MNMLDILKTRLQEGMNIKKAKELSSKYVVTFNYMNEDIKVDLSKVVAPNYHEKYCDKIIATAMSSLYLRPSMLDLEKAQEWLNKTYGKD